MLIALKGMGEYYNDDNIFKNALYGFIFGFVGVIALVVVILMFAFGFATTRPAATVFSEFGLFIIAFLILYFFSLIAAIFYKQSLDNLSRKSGESMFDTGGLILLTGAFIPVIGEVLKLVGWILVAVGFFNIKPSKQGLAQTEQMPKSEEKRFCKYCGALLQPEAIYCQKCGKKTD